MSRASSYAVVMDFLDTAANPRCPNDGTVMRDVPGAWACGECGYKVEQPEVVMPPEFDGPGIHGG